MHTYCIIIHIMTCQKAHNTRKYININMEEWVKLGFSRFENESASHFFSVSVALSTTLYIEFPLPNNEINYHILQKKYIYTNKF